MAKKIETTGPPMRTYTPPTCGFCPNVGIVGGEIRCLIASGATFDSGCPLADDMRRHVLSSRIIKTKEPFVDSFDIDKAMKIGLSKV